MLLPTRRCKDPWKPKVILHIDRHPIRRENFTIRETTGCSGKSYVFFYESKGFHRENNRRKSAVSVVLDFNFVKNKGASDE